MKPPKERIFGYVMFGILANLFLITGALSLDIYVTLTGLSVGCWLLGIMTVFVFVEKKRTGK